MHHRRRTKMHTSTHPQIGKISQRRLLLSGRSEDFCLCARACMVVLVRNRRFITNWHTFYANGTYLPLSLA